MCTCIDDQWLGSGVIVYYNNYRTTSNSANGLGHFVVGRPKLYWANWTYYEDKRKILPVCKVLVSLRKGKLPILTNCLRGNGLGQRLHCTCAVCVCSRVCEEPLGTLPIIGCVSSAEV